MLTFDDLSVTRAPLKCSIPSLKKAVTLKALAFREVLAIRTALEKPVPPMVDDVRRGSLAPKVPNWDDAAFKREFNDYARAVRLGMIARSMEYCPRQTTEDTFAKDPAAWVNAVEADLGAILTEDDVEYLGRQYDIVNGASDAARTVDGDIDPKVFSSLPVTARAMMKELVAEIVENFNSQTRTD